MEPSKSCSCCRVCFLFVMHARALCRFPLRDPSRHQQRPRKSQRINLCTQCFAFNHPLYLPRLQKFSKFKNLKSSEGQKELKKKQNHKTTIFYLNSGEEKQNSLLMWKQALSLSVHKTFKIAKTGHQFCGINTRTICGYIPFDRACFFC